MRLLAILAIGFLPFVLNPLVADDGKTDAKEDKKPEPRVCHVPYRITPVYHILVRAKVNGAGPVNLIIDTGCNVVILTPSACRKFGIALNGGRLDRIEFEGGVVIEKNRCNVNEPRQVSAPNANNAEGCELHGVIGMDILKRFQIDLDYDQHKMTWTRVAKDAKADEKAAQKKEMSVALEMSKSDHVIVQVKLNGKGPYRFLYDTGSPVNTVNPRLMKAGPDRYGVVETLEMGGVSADQVPVIVMNPPPFDGVDGIIGFPLIARYKSTMDFPAKTIRFLEGTYVPPAVPTSVANARPAKVKEPPAIEKPFGLVVAKGKVGVLVMGVVDGGAGAAAGLKVGDRLLVIDDVWAITPADCSYVAGRAKPGSTVGVRLERDGKDLAVQVQVKDAPRVAVPKAASD